MKWTSVLAIYFLIFCLTAFLMLPFGVKTHEEVGAERVPGQADSAPHQFDLPRHLLRASVIAVLLTGLYIANYQFGWIKVEDLDFYNPPEPVNAS
jgi:predicted secreted protein